MWNNTLSFILVPMAADPSATDFPVFAQYGVLGVIAAGLIWFAKGAHQRERERADRLEDENRKLNGLVQDRVIPALTSATRLAEESSALLIAVQHERERQLRLDRAIRRPPEEI